VWEEFETIERMRTWYGVGHALVTYEPRVGGEVETDATGDHDGVHGELRFVGRVVVFDPPRQLTFEQDWVGHGWPTAPLITIRLSPVEGGTLVELFHHGFERFGSVAAGADDHRGFEDGWTMRQLEALRGRVAG
jgi:uncharacterized protein YndB with AHSA1/START domain